MKYHFANVDDEFMNKYINMVKKIYPDFNPDTQYCFWIVADFFDDKLLFNVEGHVSLFDENNKLIDYNLLFKAKPITRKPYYNKYIRQIGLKNGRSKCFGIPLVFNTLNELQKIKQVKIHWDITKPIYMLDNIENYSVEAMSSFLKTLEVRLLTLDVVYCIDFNFDKANKNHWFTLSHKDKFYDEAICVADIHVNKNMDGDYCANDCLIQTYTRENLKCVFSEKQLKTIEELLMQNIDCLVAMAKHYEKSIQLSADPYPDIIPESGFGFK